MRGKRVRAVRVARQHHHSSTGSDRHIVELRDYWRTVKRRWMTIVACLLLTVAVAGVVTWQTTPQYASTARLFVSTSPSDASQAYQGGLFATQRVASYADLIQSQQLAEQVSQDLGGEPTAAE